MTVFVAIFIGILFASGVNWKVLAIGLAAFGISLILFISNILPEYLMARINVLKNLDVAKRGIGHQQFTGRITIASGRLFGKGFDSIKMIKNNSEVYNDMIFAHVGQTVGFVGCLIFLILLAILCARILTIGKNAKDDLGTLICVGAASLIIYQSIVSIGMVLCIIPVIGIPLPFISAGGSSLLANYLLIGLVLSVNRCSGKAELFKDALINPSRRIAARK